jgi:hypothetical protein
VHFDGFKTAIYFATFPSHYLNCVRNENLTLLQNWSPKVELHHTKLYNLFHTVERTEFIREIVALFRFVAAGEANIGHLRKDGTEIHRNTDDSGNPKDEPVLGPPQQAMGEQEEALWRNDPTEEYAS